MTHKVTQKVIYWVIMLSMVVFCARAFATSIHWEDITPFGDDRMVIIDRPISKHDLEVVCSGLPLDAFAVVPTDTRSIMVLEPGRFACWDLIKEYIEEQFGGSD
jgi:hypothetical protein